MRLVSIPAATSEAAPRPETVCFNRLIAEAPIDPTIAIEIAGNRNLRSGHRTLQQKKSSGKCRSLRRIPAVTTAHAYVLPQSQQVIRGPLGRYLMMRISDQS
jgi:hypothetical protein